MISNAQLRSLAAYKHHRTCELDNVFIAEGPKLAAEIFSAHIPIHTLCATPQWMALNENFLPEIPNIFEVTPDKLARLSHLRNPNEVWLLVQRDFPVPDLPASHLTLALDHIQDPGNLGTIIRTADWFGVRRILCSDDTVSQFNPKVVQSTMGSLFRVSLTYTDLPSALAAAGCPVYGALLSGQDVRQIPAPSEPAILLIGNESRGISPDLIPLVSHQVLIPNLGNTAESLNAAVATSILLSHWLLR